MKSFHTNDTVQEKLSLVARFGVTIYFGSPDKKDFVRLFVRLQQKNKIEMPEEDLLLEANKWELSHGGLSGRRHSSLLISYGTELRTIKGVRHVSVFFGMFDAL